MKDREIDPFCSSYYVDATQADYASIRPTTQPFELEYNYGFNDAYGRGVKDNKWLTSATPHERYAYNEGYKAGLKRRTEEQTK